MGDYRYRLEIEAKITRVDHFGTHHDQGPEWSPSDCATEAHWSDRSANSRFEIQERRMLNSMTTAELASFLTGISTAIDAMVEMQQQGQRP